VLWNPNELISEVFELVAIILSSLAGVEQKLASPPCPHAHSNLQIFWVHNSNLLIYFGAACTIHPTVRRWDVAGSG